MFRFDAHNPLVGIEARSLANHSIPPSNLCSVQRELSFCSRRTQNDDLSEPVGPAIIQVNGCLNLTSVLIALVEMTLSQRHLLIYTRTELKYYRLYVAS